MKAKSIALCAVVMAPWMLLAAGPAEALTTTLSKTFSYSTPVAAGEQGNLTPSGAMSATFGPVHFDGISSVEIDWNFAESFTGNTGSSGGNIRFDFGGVTAVDGNGYDGNGSGGSSYGPAYTPISASTSVIDIDEAFPNVNDNPAIYSELTGSNAYTVSWNIGQNDGFQSSDTIYGTLSGSGEVQVTYTYAAAPEPASWALLLTGFAAVGALARRRPRHAVSRCPPPAQDLPHSPHDLGHAPCPHRLEPAGAGHVRQAPGVMRIALDDPGGFPRHLHGIDAALRDNGDLGLRSVEYGFRLRSRSVA